MNAGAATFFGRMADCANAFLHHTACETLRHRLGVPYSSAPMIDPIPLLDSAPTAMAGPPGRGDGLDDAETGVVTRTRPKTKKPANYKVLMLNDDYTPMEFVVLVLQRYFSMGIEDATRVMLQVHQQGVAICGVFTYEVAETKVSQVIDFARENQHPLQCTLEKA